MNRTHRSDETQDSVNFLVVPIYATARNHPEPFPPRANMSRPPLPKTDDEEEFIILFTLN